MTVRIAFILAAGLGTRLKPFSDSLPKPAWPLFDRPIAAHLVSALADAGVERFIINLHHLPELMKEALTPHLPPGVKVDWSREERILGTGGALTPWLGTLSGEPFFLANADTVRGFDPALMAARYNESGADAVLSLAPLPEGATGPVGVDLNGRIVSFVGAKAPECGKVAHWCEFTGVHVIGPNLSGHIARAARAAEKFCINADVHKVAIAEGFDYRGFLPEGGFWSDLGTPSTYLSAHFGLLDGGEPPARTGRLYLADEGTPGGGRVFAPSWLGDGAKVGDGATAGPHAVLCRGAELLPGAAAARAVVWPGAKIDGAVEGICAPWGETMGRDGKVRSWR